LKNRICIIGVYFGKLPEHFNLWLKSCFSNKKIDFFVFTDNSDTKVIKNVHMINMKIEDLKKLSEAKIGVNVNLKRPYKCCDLKPFYGVIFSDYIKQYKYWGHCDFDMIFGDISSYLEKYNIDNYDKFLPLGHLSFYKNIDRVNFAYKLNGSEIGDYKEVLASEDNYAFDEYKGIYKILLKNHFSIFDKRLFADISTRKKRFVCALKDKNYKKQIFCWENGKVFRYYFQDAIIKKEEFIYIHFQKRKMKNNVKNAENDFYIVPNSFIDKQDEDNILKMIKKYNRYHGLLYEYTELFLYKIKNKYNEIKNGSQFIKK